ncbi:MAG: glycoside hydrolase family 3 protein, partial [Muribaculaceae bacterium]|nr:glycoside hydrolase family 3 protein [Muribaculaceae bacterium]
MQGMKHTAIILAMLAAIPAAWSRNEITHEEHDGFTFVKQTEGPTLGYSPASGVKIIMREGYAFKSYDGRDSLLPYADWRLPAAERAADLASRLSMDEIAGLMLYSPQNHIPNKWDTYDGMRFEQTAHNPWDLSDGQLRYLKDENVRHVLVSSVSSPEVAARWNNTVQAYVEGLGHGIPANNSSDPRHSAFHDAEFAPGASGQLSMWSNGLGMAATFDPATVHEFGEIMRAEYRALGIATALSPQADIATDPRWFRFNGTYGNDPHLTADMVREYVDALQSSPENDRGDWGSGSVNAMVKHWPGGGTGEAGRDAHLGTGKFAVYPGGHYSEHKIPFVKGAFALPGATGRASAVMPYYTISYGQADEAVGNAFSHDMISRQLRGECGYDGVVCTDWAITADAPVINRNAGKPWGVEKMGVAERHYKALKAGVDQFGGNYEKAPVLEAYEIGCAEIGREAMDERMRESARRLLLNLVRPGLWGVGFVAPAGEARTVG